jgi:hypothetical protein
MWDFVLTANTKGSPFTQFLVQAKYVRSLILHTVFNNIKRVISLQGREKKICLSPIYDWMASERQNNGRNCFLKREPV